MSEEYKINIIEAKEKFLKYKSEIPEGTNLYNKLPDYDKDGVELNNIVKLSFANDSMYEPIDELVDGTFGTLTQIKNTLIKINEEWELYGPIGSSGLNYFGVLNQFNEFVNNLKVEVTEDGDYFLGDTEGNQPDLEEGEVETNNCFLVDGENILVYISIPTRRKNFEFLIVGSGFGAEVYELGYYQADEEGFWEN